MGISIYAYTNSDAVRSSLGMDAGDCPDRNFEDSNMDMQLEADLNTWVPTHATIDSEGVQTGASAAQIAKRNYLILYSQFFCAYQIAKRPMQFIRLHGDGKSQMARFETAFKEVAPAALAEMEKYKNLLSNAVSGGTGYSTSLKVVGISTPAVDPVTGDGLI